MAPGSDSASAQRWIRSRIPALGSPQARNGTNRNGVIVGAMTVLDGKS